MLKLFRLLAPYRRYIAIVLVLALAQSLGFLLLPRLMSDIVDKGIVKGDQRAILRIGGLMLLMSIAATFCAILSSYYASKVATGFGRILRGTIFARVEHFSIHQFDRFGSASLVTRTTNDTTQVQQMLTMMLTMVITAPMMATGGVILALSQDTQLAWVLIAVMPVMALVFGVILRGAPPSRGRINGGLDRTPEIVDPAGPAEPPRAAQRGHVEFENVTFQYPGAEEPALSGVSFTAHPGEMTAIIGGTGSGKSTLAGLIPRFYDVNHGRVLVDGVDVREMTQADLRGRIGFVPQKAVLFTGTVAANIRYGRENASDERSEEHTSELQSLRQ